MACRPPAPRPRVVISSTVAPSRRRAPPRRPRRADAPRGPTDAALWVEHRDRLARFGVEYIEAALSAQGRTVRVVDPGEVEDDLVRDMTEALTSLCARL